MRYGQRQKASYCWPRLHRVTCQPYPIISFVYTSICDQIANALTGILQNSIARACSRCKSCCWRRRTGRRSRAPGGPRRRAAAAAAAGSPPAAASRTRWGGGGRRRRRRSPRRRRGSSARRRGARRRARPRGARARRAPPGSPRRDRGRRCRPASNIRPGRGRDRGVVRVARPDSRTPAAATDHPNRTRPGPGPGTDRPGATRTDRARWAPLHCRSRKGNHHQLPRRRRLLSRSPAAGRWRAGPGGSGRGRVSQRRAGRGKGWVLAGRRLASCLSCSALLVLLLQPGASSR